LVILLPFNHLDQHIVQYAGVYRTAVVPVPAYNIKLEDWVFVDIAKANVR